MSTRNTGKNKKDGAPQPTSIPSGSFSTQPPAASFPRTSQPMAPPAALPPAPTPPLPRDSEFSIGPAAEGFPPRKSSLGHHTAQTSSNTGPSLSSPQSRRPSLVPGPSYTSTQLPPIPGPSHPLPASPLPSPPGAFSSYASPPLPFEDAETSEQRINKSPILSHVKDGVKSFADKLTKKLKKLPAKIDTKNPTKPLKNVKGLDPTSPLPVYNPLPSRMYPLVRTPSSYFSPSSCSDPKLKRR